MRASGQRTYTIEELISAIRADRDIAEIRQIISGVEDINQPDNDGDTALYWAARNNNLEMVRELLALGADVNNANDVGWTALNWAAKNNNLEMLKQSLQLTG